MNDQQIEFIKKFENLRDEKNQKYFSFIKMIVPMAVGYLGIILSLADTQKMSEIKHLFYSITGTLTALGILFALIVLYGEIVSVSLLLDTLRNSIQSPKEQKGPYIVDPKIYMIPHYLCMIFFVFSLISSAVYSWF